MKNLIILLIVVGFPLLTCNSKPEMKVDTTPVKHFDVERYLGTWYEIARFPHRFEKDLVGVTATYSKRDDGKIKVVNKGYADSLDGEVSTITGKAKLAGDPDTGHLKVSFFWIFYADYKILELDTANYQYALVGSSSDNYLWILARAPKMPEETYSMLVDTARARGYNVEKLDRVKQKPLPEPEKDKTIAD